MNLSQRLVQSEWLDTLPTEDPRAMRARYDLRWVNWLMCNAVFIARAFTRSSFLTAPHYLLELGAGDGNLLLRVARQMHHRWPQVHLTLVDRHPLLAPQIRLAFENYGWSVEVITGDVMEWLNTPPRLTMDILLCNLFLHHFPADQLRQLLHRAALHTHYFLACEPERSPIALTGASLLRCIGCNAVTQHDALISVRAGFRQREISDLWPHTEGWQLNEYRAGWFSHIFQAFANA